MDCPSCGAYNPDSGYRASEDQELDMWCGAAEMATDIQSATVLPGDSAVRIAAGGIDLERLEYPEK